MSGREPAEQTEQAQGPIDDAPGAARPRRRVAGLREPSADDASRAAEAAPDLPAWRHGRVRSFTRRSDRMAQSHRAALEEFGPRFVLDPPRPEGAADGTVVTEAARLDLEQVYGRRAPLVVEVGAGSGDALLAGAAARPDLDFLALEVWRPGVAQSLLRMREAPLPNVRFAEVDAMQALPLMLAPGAVAEVWTYFPDPWPKARHAKRRLVGPAFAGVVHGILEPGGLWRIATDWPAYAEHVDDVLGADERFELDSRERAPLRPVTRFERKGEAAGRPIADTAWRRRP